MDLIAQLGMGEKPDKKVLARKLEAALVKKAGVLQVPYLCQSSDPKINPPARHLLVAAAFLGAREKIRLTLDILATELAQRYSGKEDKAASQVIAEAKKEIDRLLSPYPEELACWWKIMADLENEDTRRADG